MNIRARFVIKAQDTQNFSMLCEEFGISRKTGYKWLDKFKEEGVAGMADTSRRPKVTPNSLDEVTVCRIVVLRTAHPHWGARKLQELFRRLHGEPPSESSFKRILERSGMVAKRPKLGISKTGNILNSGLKALASNDVWTIDFKGWWYDAEGRSNPLTVRDEYSRYILEIRHLPDATGETVRACLGRLFERHGLPKAIRSDNGTPFACTRSILGISKLSAWWLALGIGLERSRPGCPQDNGAHERMHLDVMREIESIAKRKLKGDNPHEMRQAGFDRWRKEFNEERPHEALGQKMPSEVYKDSVRRYKPGEFDLDYEGMETRAVQPAGTIRVAGVRYFISTSMSGWDVGLKLMDGRYEVRFGNLVLGTLDAETESFHPVVPPEKPSRKRSKEI